MTESFLAIDFPTPQTYKGQFSQSQISEIDFFTIEKKSWG